jgi:hypothetical protein
LQSLSLVEHGLPSNDTINGRDNWEEFVLEFFGAAIVWTSATVSWTGKRIPDDSPIDWWDMEERDSKAVPGIDKRCEEVGEERAKEDDRRWEPTLVTGYWSSVMSEVMRALCSLSNVTRRLSSSGSESDSPEIQISNTASIPDSLRSSVDRPTSRDVAKIWMTNAAIATFESAPKLKESEPTEERDLIQDFTLLRSAFSLTIRSPTLSMSNRRKSIAFKNSALGVEQDKPMWLSSQSQTDTHSTSNNPQPAKVTFGSYLETNRQLPWPEQELGHDWGIGRQTLDRTLHSWKSLFAQSTSNSQGRGLEVGSSERVRRRVAEIKRQRVFEAPARPTDPDRHSPQVPSTREQSSRFNDPQSGEPEQFTWFKTVAVDDKAFFRSSALLLNFEPLIPFNRKTLRSSTDIFVASTDTPPVDREEESMLSKTTTTQVRFELVPLTLEGADGRIVEVYERGSFDRNTVMSSADEVRYPNCIDRGRSSSTQPDEKSENIVSNIVPFQGETSKTPPNGGELVVTVTLLEEEYLLSRVQVRVKMKVACWGRLFPTSTKPITLGAPFNEAGSWRDNGESEREERMIDSSLTDQVDSPADFMSRVAPIFNFEEGLIFSPERRSSFKTGARESRINNSITFPQLRRSWELVDFPRNTIVNLSLGATSAWNDELIVTTTREREEVRGEKIRPPHPSW